MLASSHNLSRLYILRHTAYNFKRLHLYVLRPYNLHAEFERSKSTTFVIRPLLNYFILLFEFIVKLFLGGFVIQTLI